MVILLERIFGSFRLQFLFLVNFSLAFITLLRSLELQGWKNYNLSFKLFVILCAMYSSPFALLGKGTGCVLPLIELVVSRTAKAYLAVRRDRAIFCGSERTFEIRPVRRVFYTLVKVRL